MLVVNIYSFIKEITLLDQMEDGWRKAFGMLMVKDIDKALKGHDLYIDQIKEKYGRLTIYFSTHNDVYQDVNDIIEAYSHLSENICINCGQVDVGYTKGYVLPLCKKCFCYDDYHTEEDYYKQISTHNRMPLYYKYSKANLKTNEWDIYTVDISEYTNKVRKQWYNKHRSI